MAGSQEIAAPVIRELHEPEEFEACFQLQKEVWGFADRDLVPTRMFVVAAKTGGQVLGAWSDQRLAGFGLTLYGCREGRNFWHSHMLAVAPGFRDQGLGRRIKLRQREEALARGITQIEWTFDPLEIKNGYFNLEVLGALARHYHPNLYGFTTSALQAGLPTDRLTAEWNLRSPRVVAKAEDRPAPPLDYCGRVEIPAAIAAWKHAGDARALAEQTRIRAALLAAFAAGEVAAGYQRGPSGGAFLLRAAVPPQE